jgi:hypothetical protein
MIRLSLAFQIGQSGLSTHNATLHNLQSLAGIRQSGLFIIRFNDFASWLMGKRLAN